MPQVYKRLPDVAELWNRYSYNPLTGNLHHRLTGPGRTFDAVVGSFNLKGYRAVNIRKNKRKEQFLVARVTWAWHHGKDPGDIEVDHQDRCRSNNRISNLRLATGSQQNANSVRPKASGLPRGVHPNGKKYRTKIYLNGKCTELGTFPTPELAHAAYCAAAQRLYGEFALLTND